ncbi:hypothetical protein IWW38_006298, partial [Coemansia aciculifera]
MAKGERQMEHERTDGREEGARFAMNNSVRDVVRSQLTGPLGNTLALVVAAGKRPDVFDSTEAWLPFLDETVSTWLRYTMPWRGMRQPEVETATSGLSEAWQLRLPVVVWSIGAPLYAPVVSDLLQMLAGPRMDLLARAPRSVISDSSALAHLHKVDALSVVELVALAFAPPELRAILVAADHLSAPPHRLSSMSLPGFERLVADAKRSIVSGSRSAPPPSVADSSVFTSPHSPLLKGLVTALQRARNLCDRQLRLLAPPPVPASEQAQTMVTDIFDLFSRIFSQSTTAVAPTIAESAAARAHTLHNAQRRIAAVAHELASVFNA